MNTLALSASALASIRSLAHALDPVAWARDQLGFGVEAWQANVLRSTAPRVGLNCTRQAGKSTIAAALALHTANYRPGSLVLIAAPSMRQSGELYRKVHAFIRQLDAPPDLAEENATTITLANGSRIVVIPASEATSRGFSNPALIILDEASRITDEAIAAIRPMQANGGGRLLYLSTPYGQRGAFFQAWTDHRADWEWHTIRGDQIPRIDPDWLAAEKRALGPSRYAQEFECSFEATDSALFDLDQIAGVEAADVRPLFGPGGTYQDRALENLVSSNVRPLFG